MANISINNEKNGIEIRFDVKPNTEILEKLKAANFRWSNRQKMWYAKQNEETIAFAKSLTGGDYLTAFDTIQENNKMCLWESTRVDNIEDNYNKYHISNTKKIAAEIRKHLRNRFKMCKWSVRSDHNSIDVKLLSSPYAVDSEVIKAIVHYAYKYTQSYNYDNSDLMTDYFDVNFYGAYETEIAKEYRYTQREATVSEFNAEQCFMAKKSEYEEEKIKKELELAKIKETENKKIQAEREDNHRQIEENVVVEDADYFIINCSIPNTCKESRLEAYLDNENVKYSRQHCKISRNVYLSENDYKRFTNQLLDDYTFLSGMGGSATDDLRVQNIIDYEQMTAEERKTVEFYNCDCVAVYCDNELQLVVNPEGYNYARYVYFVDEQSQIEKEHLFRLGISKDEYKQNVKAAKVIEECSQDIISQYHIEKSWRDKDFKLYKQRLEDCILMQKYRFDSGVVRAISTPELKQVMYTLLGEYNGIQNQIAKAGFKEDQKITIIQIGDMGRLNISRVYFKSQEYGSYAQYKNAVKLTFKPEKKRKLYYNWYYRDVLIYDGWLDIPDNLLWEEIEEGNFTIRKSRFLSCDDAQYDTAIKYFKDKNISPVVNTYKP